MALMGATLFVVNNLARPPLNSLLNGGLSAPTPGQASKIGHDRRKGGRSRV